MKVVQKRLGQKQLRQKQSVRKSSILKGILACSLASILAFSLLVGCKTDKPVAESTETPAATAPLEQQPNMPGPLSFKDDLGNEVAVDNPQRVVACLASFAQTWQLAGGSELVGLTEDAKTEGTVELPAKVGYVGTYDGLNLEAIIALEPDLVILSGAAQYKQTELQEVLKSSGITYAYFNITHFEDYLRMLKIFTDISGRTDLYEKNGTAVKTSIEDILAKAAKATPNVGIADAKPTAFFLITYSRGTRVQNGDTMPGRMLTELGCINLADENPSLLSEFSIEGLIEANPDYIFVLPMGNDAAATAANLQAALEGNPAWAEVAAVKNGKYFMVDQEHFLYKPNNRWAESYEILYQDLYG